MNTLIGKQLTPLIDYIATLNESVRELKEYIEWNCSVPDEPPPYDLQLPKDSVEGVRALEDTLKTNVAAERALVSTPLIIHS